MSKKIIKVTRNKSRKKPIKKIQKGGTKQLTNEEIKRLSKKVELEKYEGFFDDDMGLDLYDVMVEKGVASQICRGTIKKGYIKDAFEKEDVNGYIAHVDKKPVAFIIYYKKKDSLYLDLICSAKTQKTKGIPLGQLLLAKMEEFAKKKGIKKMTADAVGPAMPFYLKMGWVSTGKAKDGKREIMKVIKTTVPIKKITKKPTKKPTKKSTKKLTKKITKSTKKSNGFIGTIEKIIKNPFKFFKK